MSKHYATKLKERIAELEAEVRELVLNPTSKESECIRQRTFFERDIDNAVWAGDTTIKWRGGILAQMSDPNIEYIKTNNINVDNLLGDAHSLLVKDSMEKMIDYCRALEKDYVEGDGVKSGLAVLHELVGQGTMSPYHYANIVDAVRNYKVPYEINIIKKDGEVSD